MNPPISSPASSTGNTPTSAAIQSILRSLNSSLLSLFFPWVSASRQPSPSPSSKAQDLLNGTQFLYTANADAILMRGRLIICPLQPHPRPAHLPRHQRDLRPTRRTLRALSLHLPAAHPRQRQNRRHRRAPWPVSSSPPFTPSIASATGPPPHVSHSAQSPRPSPSSPNTPASSSSLSWSCSHSSISTSPQSPTPLPRSKTPSPPTQPRSHHDRHLQLPRPLGRLRLPLCRPPRPVADRPVALRLRCNAPRTHCSSTSSPSSRVTISSPRPIFTAGSIS